MTNEEGTKTTTAPEGTPPPASPPTTGTTNPPATPPTDPPAPPAKKDEPVAEAKGLFKESDFQDEESKDQDPKKDDATASKEAKVEYDLKVPEGSLIDKSDLERIATIARERGLNAEQTQLLVDEKHAAINDFQTKQQQNLKATTDGWYSEIETDPVLGGQKFEESRLVALDTLKKYGTKSFNQMLAKTGLANNPDFFRFLHTIGQATEPGRIVKGTPSSTTPEKTTAQRLYPSASDSQ